MKKVEIRFHGTLFGFVPDGLTIAEEKAAKELMLFCVEKKVNERCDIRLHVKELENDRDKD